MRQPEKQLPRTSGCCRRHLDWLNQILLGGGSGRAPFLGHASVPPDQLCDRDQQRDSGSAHHNLGGGRVAYAEAGLSVQYFRHSPVSPRLIAMPDLRMRELKARRPQLPVIMTADNRVRAA